MTGPSDVCMGTDYTYTYEGSSSGIQWSIPSGFTLKTGNLGPNGSQSITLTVNSGTMGGVTATGGAGYQAIGVSLNIPVALTSSIGPEKVCNGQTSVQYSISCTGTIKSYTWFFNGGTGATGATIASSTNSSSITVNYTSAFAGANLQGIAIGACGSGTKNFVIARVDPTVNAGSDISACSNKSFTVNDATGANYPSIQWSHNGIGTLTNATTLTPTYTPAAGDVGANVTLTLTTTGICTPVSDSKTLYIQATPIVEAGVSAATCVDNAYAISVNEASVSNNSSLQWAITNGSGSLTNPTTSTPTYTPAAGDAGNTVKLTITAGGIGTCDAVTDTKDIIVYGKPTANAGADVATCANVAHTVSGTSATNNTSIQWTRTGTGALTNATTLSPTFTPALADANKTITLTMTVGGYSNCAAATDTKNITIYPLPSITMTKVLDSTCLNANPITLNCGSPQGGVYSGPGVSNGQFDPTKPGVGVGTKTILYVYTEPTHSCKDTGTTTMKVLVLPSVSIGTYAPVCKDSDPIVLSSGKPTGGTYMGNGVWSNTFDPSKVTSSGDQVITYIYTDNKGNKCSNSITTTIKVLDVGRPAWPAVYTGTAVPPLTGDSVRTIMCKGNNQTLRVTNQGSDTVKWFDGSNNLISKEATYIISNITQDIPLKINYTDANNCVSYYKNITFYADRIKAGFSAPTTVKAGAAVNFTDTSRNAAQWLWTFGKEGSSTLQNPVFYFNKGTKDIKLVVTSNSNCKDSVTMLNYINVTTTGLKNLNNTSIIAYPSPFKDIINIDFTGINKQVVISVYNITGIKVIDTKVEYASGIERLDASMLPAGSYILVLTTEEGSFTTKLIKE